MDRGTLVTLTRILAEERFCRQAEKFDGIKAKRYGPKDFHSFTSTPQDPGDDVLVNNLQLGDIYGCLAVLGGQDDEGRRREIVLGILVLVYAWASPIPPRLTLTRLGRLTVPGPSATIGWRQVACLN
jgi:hypothetical protein